MVFSLYIILHGWTDFFVFSCVLFCFFLILYFCVCAFMLLCSILLVILSLLLVIMGGQHDGLFLSGSPPVFTFVYTCVFFSWQINSAAAAANGDVTIWVRYRWILLYYAPGINNQQYLLDCFLKNSEYTCKRIMNNFVGLDTKYSALRT